MKSKSESSVIEKGIKTLLKELGPVKTIEFFQALGLNKGNSLREIESITEKLGKEDVFKALKKIRSAKYKPSIGLINKVVEEVRAKKKGKRK